MAVVVAHFLLPWTVTKVARTSWGVPLRRPSAAQTVYDIATVALALGAVSAGTPGGRTLAVAACGWAGSRPGPEATFASTVVVAAAEEVLWRTLPAWSVVPFALMHRPVYATGWTYHLAAGAAFQRAARLGSVPLSTVTHALHNLAVASRARGGPERRSSQQSAGTREASTRGLAASPSSSWAVSAGECHAA